MRDRLQEELGTLGRLVARLQETPPERRPGPARPSYRNLVEQPPAISYTATPDEASTTLYVSPQVEKMLGYTQADYAADPEIWRKLQHPDDRDRVRAELAEARETGKPFSSEYRMIARDGRVVWFRDHATVERDAEGKPLLLQGVMIDITDRKLAEQALRASEERFRLLAENMTDVLWVSDLDLRPTYISPSATVLLGYSNEELLALPLEQVLTPASREIALKAHEAELALEKAAGGEPRGARTLELEVVRKDGSTVWIEARAALLRDGAGRPVGVLGVARDIEDRVRLERQMAETSRVLQQQIAQDLHDDVGQTLSGVALLAKALERSLRAKGLPQADQGAQIAKLLSRTVEQTRRLAKGLRPVELEEHGLMAALGELAANMAGLSAVSCRFQCREPVLVSDNAVATHLYYIAREAIGNAIRHGKAQNVVLNLSSAGGEIMLTVRDDGTGFDGWKPRSEGMGLTIMRHRARMVGASLDVRPGPGGGTIVACTLPATR